MTDALRDWIKALSTLCPGDLNFEPHIEGCEPSGGGLGPEGWRTEGECAQPSTKMSSSRFTTGQWDLG